MIKNQYWLIDSLFIWNKNKEIRCVVTNALHKSPNFLVHVSLESGIVVLSLASSSQSLEG